MNGAAAVKPRAVPVLMDLVFDLETRNALKNGIDMLKSSVSLKCDRRSCEERKAAGSKAKNAGSKNFSIFMFCARVVDVLFPNQKARAEPIIPNTIWIGVVNARLQ